MKRELKTGTAFIVAAALALTGCGDGGGGETQSGRAAVSDDPESVEFTWLLDDGVENIYYEDYNDNPVVKYWKDMEWDADGDGTGKKISVTFNTPPAGAQSDNFNTLLGTGEYPDVMAMSYSSQNAQSLYEEGIVLDLTEYVENYMPNYKAWMQEHADKAAYMSNDGKYLGLYTVADVPEDPWGGFMYRRDWLVKYGKNPTSGEAFTGGWNADKTEWTDDVVFPSGGSDPVYISDWEWMLGIFQEALAGEGIADGYAFQQYSAGFLGSGDLNGSFGAPMCNYIDEDGTVKNGMASESARAYMQCMNHWYEQGWVNANFEENVNDVFFMVDTAATYSGKVGLWYGLISQLGAAMAGEGLEDLCVYGAAQPINDRYGDDSCRNREPACFFQTDLVSSMICITDKAKDKDIATLCTAIDYFYGHEGGLLRTYGFSDEQQAQVQDAFYNDNGFDRGVYTATEENGTTVYHIDPNRDIKNMGVPLNGIRLAGTSINDSIDWGRDSVTQHGIDEMKKYIASAAVSSTITNQLTADQSTEVSTINANLTTYLSQAVPNFIIGREDIDDDGKWQEYCDTVVGYGTEEWVSYLNAIVGK